jgi:hypothetical protein
VKLQRGNFGAVVKNCIVINSRKEIDDSTVLCGCSYVKFAVNERRRAASPVYPFSKLLYATKSQFFLSRFHLSQHRCCISSLHRHTLYRYLSFFFFVLIFILYCNDIMFALIYRVGLVSKRKEKNYVLQHYIRWCRSVYLNTDRYYEMQYCV